MLDTNTKVSTPALSKNKDSDVKLISRILKERFSSPEKAAEALNGFDPQLSAFSNGQKRKKLTGTLQSCTISWLLYWENRRNSILRGNWRRKRMNLKNVTSFIMAKVMRRLATAGQHVQAIQAFHEMEGFGLDKNTAALNILIGRFGERR